MARASAGTLLAAATLCLWSCARNAPTPTINALMTGVMEPDAEKVWGVASNAYNDVGDGLVAARIGDADWKAIARASAALKDRAQILATARHIVVARADEPILGSQAVGEKGTIGAAWDAVDAKTVQERIDARPDLFRQKARDLVDAADAIHRAAQTRDVALFYRISSELDEVCDGCHEPFWGTDEPPPAPR